ncbi:MAG TPA: hypothetical protein VMX12_10915 [Acidimicrobiia bacterium]|nr:hypothetical protein [Acidimicrobiia bacterium]
MTALTSSIVWRVTPALLGALDEHLGSPVDSYVNGTQVWLTPEPTSAPTERHGSDGEATLEWRLHPAAGFRTPAGCSHHDLWDEAQTAIATLVDAHPTGGGDAITIGDERRGLTSLWDGLECFPAYGDELEPAALAARARALMPVEPTASGLVDHGRIGKAWERSGGRASIVDMLFEELRVAG